MFVFVDSTAFVKDPYAAKMSWNRLGDWKDCEDWATIVVPKIVMDEIVTQYRISLTGVGSTLNRSLHHLGKLLPHVDWSLPPILTDGAVDQYRDTLAKRLASLRVEQPDHSGIVLTTFPGRSTKAIIVSNMILDRLSGTNETAVLITGNSSDFGTPQILVPVFSADLERRGIRRDQIRIYRSLFDFVRAHVKPRLKKWNEFIDAIEAETHPFDPNSLFEVHYHDIFESVCDFVELWHDIPWHFNTHDFGSPQLAQLSTIPEHFQIETVDMNENQFIMFVRYWVDGIVSCEYKRSGPDAAYSGRVSFEIHASILLDMNSGEVEDFEVGEDFACFPWREDWQEGTRPDASENA